MFFFFICLLTIFEHTEPITVPLVGLRIVFAAAQSVSLVSFHCVYTIWFRTGLEHGGKFSTLITIWYCQFGCVVKRKEFASSYLQDCFFLFQGLQFHTLPNKCLILAMSRTNINTLFKSFFLLILFSVRAWNLSFWFLRRGTETEKILKKLLHFLVVLFLRRNDA